jgi:hypothetical protein
MSLTHEIDVRNGLADYVVDQLDGGNLVFMTIGETTEVATLSLGSPAFGAAAAGTATANAITSDASATGGTVATFKFETAANARKFGGVTSIVGAGGDIELSSLAVGAGDTVSMSSFTYSSSV